MDMLSETESFADWFDALRVEAGGDAVDTDTAAPLPAEIFARLEKLAKTYDKQSTLPESKRSRLGVLLVGATGAQQRSIAAYLTNRLALRSVAIDAASVEGVEETDVIEKLSPLIEQTARVAMVYGLSNDVDVRVRDALRASKPDVFVVGCVDADVAIDGALRRSFGSILEVEPKRSFARGLFALGAAPLSR